MRDRKESILKTQVGKERNTIIKFEVVHRMLRLQCLILTSPSSQLKNVKVCLFQYIF